MSFYLQFTKQIKKTEKLYTYSKNTKNWLAVWFTHSLKMEFYKIIPFVLLISGREADREVKVIKVSDAKNLKDKLQFETNKVSEVQEQREKDEKHFLSKILPILYNIKTWRNVKDKTFFEKTPTKHNREKNQSDLGQMKTNFLAVINDVLSTYAYYAKEFVVQLSVIVEDDCFAACPVIYLVINELKRTFVETTLKALATVYYVNYELPRWMVQFYRFIQKRHFVEQTLRSDIIRIRAILELVSTDVEESLPDVTNLPKAKQQFIPEKVIPYEEELKKCSANFENVKRSVLNVELQLDLVLDENRSILPFYNFHDFANVAHYTRDIGAKTDEIVSYTLDSSSTSGGDGDSINAHIIGYRREVENKELLEYEISSIWNVNGFRSADLIDVLSQVSNHYENPVDRHRSELSKLYQLTNSVFEDINCNYLYYTSKHFRNLKYILLHHFTKEADFNAYGHEITNYFATSLKILATVYNKNYQATGWMVKVALCLREFEIALEDPKSFSKLAILTEKAANISTMLSNYAFCTYPDKVSPIILPAHRLYGENTQNESNENESSDRPLKTLQLKALYFKLSSSDEPDAPEGYLSRIYENLLQINYLLVSNGSRLPYDDHADFDPSKWLLGLGKFDRAAIDSLRWDTIADDGTDKNWRAAADKFLEGLDSRQRLAADVDSPFKNSVWVHDRVFDLTLAAVIRFAMTFLVRCYDVWLLIDAAPRSLRNQKRRREISTEYRTVCSEMSGPLEDLARFAGLAGDEAFGALTEAMSAAPSARAEVVRTLRTGFGRLNRCSADMRIDAHVPVRAPAIRLELDEDEWPVYREIFAKEALVSVRAVKRAAVKYVTDFKTNFDHIDFDKYNYFLQSVENQLLHSCDLR